jgi:hypothetical protein
MSLLAYISFIMDGVEGVSFSPARGTGAGAGGLVMVGSWPVPEPGAGCAHAPMVNRKPSIDSIVAATTSLFMAYLP